MNGIVKPKLDTGFKLLFASPENSELLKSLLASLLDIDIESIRSVQIMNGELLPEDAGGKFGRLDLRLKLNTKTVNLELQIKPQDDYDDRSLFYWSKMYTADLKAGQEYGELPETICINIIDFKMFECEEYHSHFQVMEKKRHELLSDKFAIHFFELPKVESGEFDKTDLRTLWLRLIDCESEDDLAMLERTNVQPIEQAVSYIRKMSADEKARERARLEEKRLHDEASIIGTARRQGMAQGIDRMLEAMRTTGLDEATINKIVSSIQQTG